MKTPWLLLLLGGSPIWVQAGKLADARAVEDGCSIDLSWAWAGFHGDAISYFEVGWQLTQGHSAKILDTAQGDEYPPGCVFDDFNDALKQNVFWGGEGYVFPNS